ncbi:MAG: hypothetical protein ABL883_11600 [Terricaulis sp.]
MAYLDSDIEGAAEIAVREVLRDRLEAFGFEGATIAAGRHYDGLPVLFIDIHYRAGAPPLPPDVSLGLVDVLRKALLGVGERRFPHVRHLLPDSP